MKKLTSRDPRTPNAARLMVNAVVPVSGPCSEARPSRKNERLPMMMMLSAVLAVVVPAIDDEP